MLTPESLIVTFVSSYYSEMHKSYMLVVACVVDECGEQTVGLQYAAGMEVLQVPNGVSAKKLN
jgi:hypothetical protein